MSYILGIGSIMYKYRCLITRVLDADTFDCVVDLGFRMSTKQRLRLAGVQAPELSTNSRKGYIAKQLVEDILETVDYKVQIHTEKTGSFGRWLATVYIDGISLNKMMLDEGIAMPYKK